MDAMGSAKWNALAECGDLVPFKDRASFTAAKPRLTENKD